ncbi:MAG TPA: DUF1697 domain-containing protein [Flavobacteriaceae bacterium]|nr:DUF1697 domain-containing protein [Flavobacteriaceae bacterium]
MKKQVLFLRGINVGGHKKVPMAELKKMLAKMGFENIQTILNSGNVVFDSKEKAEAVLIEKIADAIQNTFGFSVNVMLRSAEEIKKLIDMEPFKKEEIDKSTRLYITFLNKKNTSELELPYASAENDFRILHKTEREVFSVLNIETTKSVDAMAFLEKEFGKDVTTRNWNTILKLGKLLGGK